MFVRFASETQWRVVAYTGTQTWIDVCCELEMKHGLRNHRWSRMYFEGRLQPSNRILLTWDTVPLNGQVVLYRRPYNGKRKTPYTPLYFRTQTAMQSLVSEDDRINMVCLSSTWCCDKVLHFSEERVEANSKDSTTTATTTTTTIPTTLTTTSKKIHKPTGIPKTLLECVKTNEHELENIMKTIDGTFVRRRLSNNHFVVSDTEQVVVTDTESDTISADQNQTLLPLLHDKHKTNPLFQLYTTVLPSRARFLLTRSILCRRRSRCSECKMSSCSCTYPVPTFTFESKLPNGSDIDYSTKIHETCTHWLRGLCVNSAVTCPYLHDCHPEFLPRCKFFNTNTCTNPDCVFLHT